MRDPLNFFEPYETLPPWHENQLTRAFLVVLKLVPIAHAVWLRMVSDSRGTGAEPLPALERLPAASFQTQTGTIGATPPAESDRDETSVHHAVSVLQARDLTSDDGEAAGQSERRAVFDGVVRYGDDLALVIESKLAGNVDERQAREITIGETAWRVDPVRSRLQWRDIIGAWCDLLARDLVSGAERGVLEDFMWLVQWHFPRLQPFSELAVCRGNDYLVRLRCKAILDDLGGTPAGLRPSGAFFLLSAAHLVTQAELGSDDGDTAVRIRLCPGDTLGQAKALYTDTAAIDRLLALRVDGWTIAPNFHFGYREKGFTWTTGDISLEKYVDYWREHIGSAGLVRREDWDEYFYQLIELGIASKDDWEAFDRDFSLTKRESAIPRPGLGVERCWPFDTAARLDHTHRFGGEVRDSINTVLRALGEPILTPSVQP